MRRLAAWAIQVYQLAVSPLLGAGCRYYPTCSQYAKEAVLKHGVLRGIAFGAGRIARCHPWKPGGVDLVP